MLVNIESLSFIEFMINSSRYEAERMQYILKYLPFTSKHVLDIEELIPHMYQKKCIYKGERFRKIFDELASMILLETKIE